MNNAGTSHHSIRLGVLALLLLAIFIIHFFTAPDELCPSDANAARSETVELVNTHTLDVPQRAAISFGGDKGQYFFQNPKTNTWHSKYGIFNTLVYIPVFCVEKWFFGNQPYLSGHLLFELNLFGTFFTVITGLYLYLIACLYASNPWARVIYVLSAIYCTFWWNHTRIQSFEVFTPVLLLAAFYHFIVALRIQASLAALDGRKKSPLLHISACGILLGMLILVKTIYLIAPLLLIAFLVPYFHHLKNNSVLKNEPALDRHLALLAICFTFPILLAVTLMLAVNQYKFGSPFNTGYTQWRMESHPMSGSVLAGLFGYTLNPQYSVFIAFPLLPIAMFAYKDFWLRWRLEAMVIAVLSLLLTVANAKFVNWSGAISYGPRYLLPILPLLSVPFVLVLEKLIGGMRRPATWIATGIICAILAWSLKWQIEVNSVPFYTFYKLQKFVTNRTQFTVATDPQVTHYFATIPEPVICGDIADYKNGKPAWWCVRLLEKTPPEKRNELDAELKAFAVPRNYFY